MKWLARASLLALALLAPPAQAQLNPGGDFAAYQLFEYCSFDVSGALTCAGGVGGVCTGGASNDCRDLLKHNTASCPEPAVGFTSVCSVGGVLSRRENGGTTMPQGLILLAQASKNNIVQNLADQYMLAHAGITLAQSVPYAGKVRAISCTSTDGTATPLALTCTTPPCLRVELYIDDADATVGDCDWTPSGDTDCLVTGLAAAFSAGSEIDARFTSASDMSSSGAADLGCAIWGTFD